MTGLWMSFVGLFIGAAASASAQGLVDVLAMVGERERSVMLMEALQCATSSL